MFLAQLRCTTSEAPHPCTAPKNYGGLKTIITKKKKNKKIRKIKGISSPQRSCRIVYLAGFTGD
jgi:hypothetical protein